MVGRESNSQGMEGTVFFQGFGTVRNFVLGVSDN